MGIIVGLSVVGLKDGSTVGCDVDGRRPVGRSDGSVALGLPEIAVGPKVGLFVGIWLGN